MEEGSIKSSKEIFTPLYDLMALKVYDLDQI